MPAELPAGRFPELRDSPYFRLIRHFFHRFFDTDISGSDGEMRLGIGPLLGVLAFPGAAMSLLLFMKYSPLLRWMRDESSFDPDLAALPDKYTFLVFSMTLTGIVTILKWDALFPDRRDHDNLTPLPISTARIFSAKFAALIGFLLLFVVDINMVSSVLFPLIAMEGNGTVGDVMRFIAAHAAAVAAASVFAFCSVLALIGISMSVLPHRFFLRFTRYIQFLTVGSLLALFFSSPLIYPMLQRARTGEDSFVSLLPPVWFLGFYQQLHGKADAFFTSQSSTAVVWLLAAMTIAALTYLLNYRTFNLRSRESAAIIGGGSKRTSSLLFALADGTVMRNRFDQGTFRFVTRTLFRSDRHCAILAGCLGLGAAISVQAVAGAFQHDFRLTPAILSVSLTMMFFLMTGLRFAFGVPAEPRANWVFQITEGDSDRGDAHTITRKTMLLLGGVLTVAVTPLYALLWGGVVAVLHGIFITVVSLILVDVLLLGFRSIPFTCPSLPGRANYVLMLAAYFVGYLVFALALSRMEFSMLRDPSRFTGFAIFSAVALLAMRHLRDPEDRVRYENPIEDLQLLRISE